MKLITRKRYVEKLLHVMGTPDIKVITGVRRSGKSKLLEVFKAHIQTTVKEYNIIHINFALPEFEHLLDYRPLYDYVRAHYVEGVENFVLIDEVQTCRNFEKAINGLHATELFDIYITGSNAFLLSSDLATLFTGRTFEIKVFPFSFAEFVCYFNLTDPYTALERYLLEGGMAGSYLYNDTETKYDYIQEVFNTLIVRDIRKKYKIRQPQLMDKLIDFLMDNISNLSSPKTITNYLLNLQERVSPTTTRAYIEHLCSAFAFYRFRRYDIHGKKYLTSSDKYYLSDHTFRYAKLGTRNMDYGRMLENIVAIELLRRGYEVYVGTLYKTEIDFVAKKRNEKIYIQVSDNVNDAKTFQREIQALLKIQDAYPKMLIARTRHDTYTYEGVHVIDIANWLLQEYN